MVGIHFHFHFLDTCGSPGGKLHPHHLLAPGSQIDEDILALGATGTGPQVFIATVHSGQNQLLTDDENKLMTARLPNDMFFHQMLICGKTGSGKTVATKYLAQYFIEELEGAVLAINVKDVDFLKMDKPSVTNSPQVLEEWKTLGQKASGIDNFIVYYPANTNIRPTKGVTQDVCQRITLNVREIEPESLTGLLQGITDAGAQNLPNIFRWWQEDKIDRGNEEDFTFSNFVKYFQNFFLQNHNEDADN